MRILITGMSGTGKSSVVRELRRRGHLAYDADDDSYTEPGRDGAWHWRVDAVASLLSAVGSEQLFFAGCSEEQAEFEWDRKVLLTAPEHAILDRVATRTTNSFGTTARDRQKIVTELREVEPVLLRTADVVIDATQPLTQVADQVIAAAAAFP